MRRHDPPPRAAAESTGTATASAGGYANTGVHLGDVNLRTGAPVRTRYREQVHRIAPPELVGREPELAELADFCVSPATAGSYRWWRAAAWSGKSALMSWFVLHPPPGVRLVSFFITARLSSQNDRAAFIENVLEQLVTLLGQDLPPFLTETTRESHLLGLLGDAAELCRDRGEHLVLLVDGLDEDRGVTTGPDAHSIAALLPAVPPAGMRIIVAGRPNPPIPADLPDHHPLHDPRIVRPLAPSPHARAVRADMERELKNLLHGTPAQQDLLGLLTAAGGGLTALDLVDLTGLPEFQVNDHLRTVTGRTFSQRAAHYDPGDTVFLLGHEELQTTAQAILGPRALAGYRDRLHAWADHHRDAGWPPTTPEYLLRGYYNLLPAIDDLPRMIALATDPARHERLLDLSGADAAALTEITTALDACAHRDPPDLPAMLRLAIHRDRLTDRNANVPTDLPALWATLGHPDRAEALIRSITDPRRQTEAQQALAAALAAAGHLDQAEALIRSTDSDDLDDGWFPAASYYETDRAEHLAQSISRSRTHPDPFASVACAHAEAGDYDRAENLVQSIRGISRQCRGWGRLATTFVAKCQPGRAMAALDRAEALMGDTARDHERALLVDTLAQACAFERAETIARSIVTRDFREAALGFLARGLVAAGQFDAADRTLIAIHHMSDTVQALVVGAFAEARQFDRAMTAARSVPAYEVLVVGLGKGGLLDRAETAAKWITPSRRAAAWAMALLEAGEFDRAAVVTQSITDPDQREPVLSALVAAGELDQAMAMVASMAGARQQSWELVSLASGLAGAGRIEQATQTLNQAHAVARSVINVPYQARVLTSLATALVRIGESEWAAEMFDQAEAAARSITDPYERSEMLGWIAEPLITEGKFEQAEALARDVILPGLRDDVRQRLIEALVAAGEHDRAEAMARSTEETDNQGAMLAALSGAFVRARAFDRAESVVRSLCRPSQRVFTLRSLARDLVEAGEFARAESTVRSLSYPDRLSDALESLALALADAGELAHATRIAPHFLRAVSLRRQVRLLAKAGEFDRAERLARSIDDVHLRNDALASLITALAEAGEPDRAEELISAVSPAPRVVDTIADAQVALITTRINAGQFERAKSLARTVGDPGRYADTWESWIRTIARAGDFDLAEDLAAHPALPSATLVALARAYTELGELTRARHALDRAEQHAATPNQALLWPQPPATPLIIALAAAGELTRAETLARTLPTPAAQHHALISLATHAPHPQAIRLLAQAIPLAPWPPTLEALPTLSPPTIRTIAQELRHLPP